jgi:hypothetical protein
MPEVGFMKPVQWLLLIAVLYFTRVFYNNEFKSKAAS